MFSMSFLPEHFGRDLLFANFAYAYYYACVLALALFLQTELRHNSSIRALAGLFITSALLIGQPFVYDSPTQTYGIGMASMCCLGAWTLLHWTFMEQLHKRPSVMQVLMSTVTHPMTGVLKVFKRTRRQQAATSPQTPVSPLKAAAKASSNGRPLVVVDAGDLQAVPAAALATVPALGTANSSRAWLLVKALASILAVCITYDVGLHLLCSLSSGMCSGSGSNSSSKGVAIPTAFLAAGAGPASWFLNKAQALLRNQFVAVCVFGYVAGALLPLQMEVIFRCLRAGMLAGGFIWPALGDLAEQLPTRAFNWPIASKSISELWGYRWHAFLRFYFEGLGYTAADKLLPKGKAVSPGLRSSMHSVAAFFMSAIMHEYLTWAAFGTVTGWYMAFFGLHCVAVQLEGWGPFLLKGVFKAKQPRPSASGYSRSSQDATDTGSISKPVAASAPAKKSSTMRRWAMRMWTVSVMLLLSPLFVEPYRAAGYFAERAWHPFGAPVTPCVLSWAERHLHAQLGFAEAT